MLYLIFNCLNLKKKLMKCFIMHVFVAKVNLWKSFKIVLIVRYTYDKLSFYSSFYILKKINLF